MASSVLDRIRSAQDGPVPNFGSALAELEAGQKTDHWIWFVLPQLEGLGTSPMSRTYGLHGREDAVGYLGDATLRGRLGVVVRVMADHLGRGVPLVGLMGSDIDAKKAVSSLTLFEHVARTLGIDAEATDARADCALLGDAAGRVLAMAEAQGFPRFAFTLRRLANGPAAPRRRP
jgi:uncharacterized protein (DUF1810 family)